MIDITEMKKRLFELLASSKLDRLFKLGRIKEQNTKQPYYVSIRLKLHNAFTFLAFELVEKKSGMTFRIRHLKDMPKELRTALQDLGGVSGNGNNQMDFVYNDSIAETSQAVFKLLMSSYMIEICNAQDYKPVRLLRAEQEK